MAITPSQARARGEKCDAHLREEKIDNYLARELARGNNRPFYSIEGMSEGTILAVMEIYRRAGWIVTRGSDRDGPHLVFESKN